MLALDQRGSGSALRAAVAEAPESIVVELQRLVAAADQLARLDLSDRTSQSVAATIVTDPEVQSAQASVRGWVEEECESTPDA